MCIDKSTGLGAYQLPENPKLQPIPSRHRDIAGRTVATGVGEDQGNYSPPARKIVEGLGSCSVHYYSYDELREETF